jgi:hypothetical protein
MEQVWNMEHTINNGPKKNSVALKKTLACGVISETFCTNVLHIYTLFVTCKTMYYAMD